MTMTSKSSPSKSSPRKSSPRKPTLRTPGLVTSIPIKPSLRSKKTESANFTKNESTKTDRQKE